MKQIKVTQDVYPALDELVIELKKTNQRHLAVSLHRRMHEDVWTTGSELYEELQNILTNALRSREIKLPKVLKKQLEQVLFVINKYLKTIDN